MRDEQFAVRPKYATSLYLARLFKIMTRNVGKKRLTATRVVELLIVPTIQHCTENWGCAGGRTSCMAGGFFADIMYNSTIYHKINTLTTATEQGRLQ